MHKRTNTASDRAKNGIANERRKGMLKKQKKLFLDRFTAVDSQINSKFISLFLNFFS